MIKIKDLEEYFGKSFNKILQDNDICFIADNIKNAWKDYYKYELESVLDLYKKETKAYLNDIKTDFYKWVETCNTDKLLNYDLSTYQRHFRLENGKVYYLNSYI